ncbi:MAG TPA: hypothetical protein VNT75_05425 [Symbiobacteriaceae bacterium]|nr:hypothetical protein [Symbiobacteriaceae bacterium]
MELKRWSTWVLLVNRDLRQMQTRLSDLTHFYDVRMNSLQAQLTDRAPLPGWLSQPEITTVPDPECRDHRATVTWSLTDWIPGTKARFQFRRGTGEDWQEAPVKDQGAQSYQAGVPLAGGPGLLWRVAVGGQASPGGAATLRTIYWPPETAQYRSGQMMAVPAFQYRIVADAPGGSRATAPQVLPLGHDLIAQASFQVTAGDNREYTVSGGGSSAGKCTRVQSVVARAFAGQSQDGEYPLTRGAGDSLSVTWTSEAELTRLELVVRYGVHESVIPVDFAAR